MNLNLHRCVAPFSSRQTYLDQDSVYIGVTVESLYNSQHLGLGGGLGQVGSEADDANLRKPGARSKMGSEVDHCEMDARAPLTSAPVVIQALTAHGGPSRMMPWIRRSAWGLMYR